MAKTGKKDKKSDDKTSGRDKSADKVPAAPAPAPAAAEGQPDVHIYEVEGVRIPHDPAIISEKVVRSIEAGRYEREEVQGTPKFLEPGDRVIELGAGLGFISSYIWKAVGIRDILCLEANPVLCDFIARVHQMNGVRAEIRNCVALNDTQAPGWMDFYLREPFWSSSLDPEEAYERQVQVEGVSLSALIRKFGATTLIVDIEGGEKMLFDALDMGPVNKVFLEIHTRKIRQIGVKRCFDALSNLGFCYDQQVSRGGAVLFRRIPERQLRKG
ncbi:class I SAM-dependent methyltransferase [Phaeovulum vinaykumarii]|uniref:Methyltransferase, FkbM family n=1 Tax=Phaeovulum vinaykumarii TaxID=407234 RepID=A0A1N7LW14_9RHOB|nr:hypothetical protein [Phaeovulum vinaykumarii]SIS78023.1 methyltransferase, FkbM family [Phaeovulum vinaykumarii]SOC07198.1 FkbM family methyltransferase [Phaeovulum vinaykumarii]